MVFWWVVSHSVFMLTLIHCYITTAIMDDLLSANISMIIRIAKRKNYLSIDHWILNYGGSMLFMVTVDSFTALSNHGTTRC